MDSRNKIIFLLLVLAQGLHSVEEYFGQLWNVFPPAKFVTGLISENPETGFLIINIGFFIFGIWCWFFPVLRNYNYARGLIWFGIVIEMINGTTILVDTDIPEEDKLKAPSYLMRDLSTRITWMKKKNG